jgi:hypothetical protein
MTIKHEVRRESDDELLGFVGVEDEQWTPTTVFGAPLGAATADRDAAEDVVRSSGLASLAEPWDYTDADGTVQRAHILEASTTHVTLMVGDYFPDPTTRFTIAAPVGDALRRR